MVDFVRQVGADWRPAPHYWLELGPHHSQLRLLQFLRLIMSVRVGVAKGLFTTVMLLTKAFVKNNLSYFFTLTLNILNILLFNTLLSSV